MKITLILPFLALAFAACQPMSSRTRNLKAGNRIAYSKSNISHQALQFKADPLELIRGTTLNREIKLAAKHLLKDYYLVSKQIFRSHGNDSQNYFIQDVLPRYRFSQTIDRQRKMFSSRDDNQSLEFVKINQASFALRSMLIDNEQVDVDLLHFSLSTDEKSFSLLFSVNSVSYTHLTLPTKA